MTERELIQFLRDNKNAPEFGGAISSERKEKIRQDVYERIGFDSEVSDKGYSIFDYLYYYWYQFSHLIVRPVVIGFAAFLFIFTGWTASVQASHSIPGDVLYPVKIATENMRLRFANNTQKQARLRVEFAGRRLQEVSEIKKSNRNENEKAEQVKAAVQNFNTQINFVQNALVEVQEENPELALELALIVVSDVSEESAEEVEEAQFAVDEVNSKAIETIVQSQEETNAKNTAETLQHQFQTKYQDIKNRIAMSFGRLEVIKGALADAEVDLQDYKDRLADARLAVVLHDSTVNEAMDLLAAGGFRKAFELMDQVDVKVSESEEIIIDLEIEITTEINKQVKNVDAQLIAPDEKEEALIELDSAE